MDKELLASVLKIADISFGELIDVDYVLLQFSSPTCGQCKMMDPIVKQVASTMCSQNYKVRVIKIADTLALPVDLITRLDLTQLPTTVLLDVQHGYKELSRFGVASASKLQSAILTKIV